ncbi:importin beta-like protein Kap120p [Diutina rugosa]
MELTLDNLVATLSYASQAERSESHRQAEAQLGQWETAPGYHYLLQEVFINRDSPTPIRWLAVICFKNGVDRYWRPSKKHAISKEEKAQIRSRSFAMLDEQNQNLSVHNATAVAKIARFDFPSEWPTLFDDIERLLEQLVFDQNDMVATNNLLIILNRVIKSVSTVRIGRSRHAMQAKASTVVTLLVKLYTKFFTSWAASLDLKLMEVCYSCLKCLRRIIPEGFDQPHTNQDVCEFVSLTVDHLQGLVVEHDKYSSDLLERYVRCYTKLYYNILSNNPTSFMLLPCSQKIITTFLSLLEQKAEDIHRAGSGDGDDENDFWVVLALKGFLILKKCIEFIYKKGAITIKQRNDKAEVEASVAKLTQETFTPEAICHLCNIVINWYLRLRPSDLERWSLDGEEWWNEELSQSWEYQIRPCAENFYQELIKIFDEFLTPFIIDKISNGLTTQSDILTKDSILCTFQLSSVQLANHVSFDTLLKDLFIPQAMATSSSEGKVLKRRVCLIISEWVGVSCSRESRVEIYKFLTPLLSDEDVVVRLAAISTLRTVSEDWDFVKADFTPFFPTTIDPIIQTLNSVSLTESKLYIHKTLGGLLERCNPLVDQSVLIKVLDVIKSSGDGATEPIVKSSIVRLLRSLTITMSDLSPEVHSLALPLIRMCCSENTEYYTLLSEDGYDLWLAILTYCPTSCHSQEIVDLFGILVTGLRDSTEILPTILAIMRSYALYAPKLYCEPAGAEQLAVVAGYLATMRDDSYVVLVSLLDILMVSLDGNQQFYENLMSSGLFAAMLAYATDEAMTTFMANKLFLVMSRMAKSCPQLWFQMVEHVGQSPQTVIDVWIRYFNSNGNPRNRKINLMGLLSLTSYGVIAQGQPQGWCADAFNQSIAKTFIFTEEVNESMDGMVDAYNHDLTYEDIDDYAYLDPSIKPHGEKLRYTEVCAKDPVASTNLANFLKQCVLQVRNELGNSAFEQLVGANDQYVVEKLAGVQ